VPDRFVLPPVPFISTFYAWLREGEYGRLLDEDDRRMLSWVQEFNPYDLYSKSPVRPDWEKAPRDFRASAREDGFY
jgi:succinate dehydrogenase flavin-adding protein (antitoxin of CptAB toxin-antitoxin module)